MLSGNRPHTVCHDDAVFGRTPGGQLLYDLAFVDLTDKHLARKHSMPVARIRSLRAQREVVNLRRINKRDRIGRSR